MRFLDEQNHILQVYKNEIKNGKVDQFEIIEKDTLRKCLNFTYDSRGFINQIKSYAFRGNTFLGTEDFTTDDNGNITFIEFFNVSGQSEMTFSMALDKIGRRTAYTQFDKNDNKISGANVVFDNYGFIEEETETNGIEEKNVWRFEYGYDENENWTQCIVGNSKHRLLIARTYEYYSAE